MKNELQRHKKSDAIKWVATAIALIIILTGLIVLFLQIFGTNKQKPSEWFTKQDEPTEETTGLIVASKVNASVAEFTDMQSSSYGSYTVTATVLPIADNETSYDWFLSWQNANSVWAKDKDISDYISVENTDNRSAVKIICLQPFGERAVLRCIVNNDTELSAECVLDFLKRIESFEVVSSFERENIRIPVKCDSRGETLNSVKYDFKIHYSVGTVCGTFNIRELTYGVAQGFDSKSFDADMQSHKYNVNIRTVLNDSFSYGYTYDLSGENLLITEMTYSVDFPIMSFEDLLTSDDESFLVYSLNNNETRRDIYIALKNTASSVYARHKSESIAPHLFALTSVNCSYMFDGKEQLSSPVTIFSNGFYLDFASIPVDSVSTDPDSAIF